jgi:hypothetical protein
VHVLQFCNNNPSPGGSAGVNMHMQRCHLARTGQPLSLTARRQLQACMRIHQTAATARQDEREGELALPSRACETQDRRPASAMQARTACEGASNHDACLSTRAATRREGRVPAEARSAFFQLEEMVQSGSKNTGSCDSPWAASQALHALEKEIITATRTGGAVTSQKVSRERIVAVRSFGYAHP